MVFQVRVLANVVSLYHVYLLCKLYKLAVIGILWLQSKSFGGHVCLLSSSVMSDYFVTLWTVACQAPLSMGFSQQEYWSGLPFPPPRDLPGPGMEPESRRILYCLSYQGRPWT